jgi:hypothetical protein
VEAPGEVITGARLGREKAQEDVREGHGQLYQYRYSGSAPRAGGVLGGVHAAGKKIGGREAPREPKKKL